jgi:hypothetical protein
MQSATLRRRQRLFPHDAKEEKPCGVESFTKDRLSITLGSARESFGYDIHLSPARPQSFGWAWRSWP